MTLLILLWLFGSFIAFRETKEDRFLAVIAWPIASFVRLIELTCEDWNNPSASYNLKPEGEK